MSSDLTRTKIESLAPDQASLAAALKLQKPTSWPVLAANADQSVLWGECQGSGSTPYRVVVSPDDVGYKCTCPSRKFPCKHVLAVLWMKVDTPARFQAEAPPQWVEEWSSRRRPGTGRPSTKPKEDDGQPKAAPSLQAALDAGTEPEPPVDPKEAARAEARAKAQRERVRAEREAAVLGGLDELERWLFDQLSQGMAGFTARAQAAVRTLSTRLVDAKAAGLAGRLDRLTADIFRVPEALRADVAIERLAGLALIAAAYRNQDRLPAPLKEDVRRAIGWSVKREDLLADQAAPRVAATWIVAALASEVQPDKLRRLETWLLNATPAEGAPRVALLVDFVPVSGGAMGFPFAAGDTIAGEVVFYPSAAPLRGLLAMRSTANEPARWPKGHDGLLAALADFRASLGALPWLDLWPLLIDGVSIRTAGKAHLALTDAAGVTLPIDRADVDALVPLLGFDAISVLVTWDGRTASVLMAETPAGQWHRS